MDNQQRLLEALRDLTCACIRATSEDGDISDIDGRHIHAGITVLADLGMSAVFSDSESDTPVPLDRRWELPHILSVVAEEYRRQMDFGNPADADDYHGAIENWLEFGVRPYEMQAEMEIARGAREAADAYRQREDGK